MVFLSRPREAQLTTSDPLYSEQSTPLLHISSILTDMIDAYFCRCNGLESKRQTFLAKHNWCLIRLWGQGVRGSPVSRNSGTSLALRWTPGTSPRPVRGSRPLRGKAGCLTRVARQPARNLSSPRDHPCAPSHLSPRLCHRHGAQRDARS